MLLLWKISYLTVILISFIEICHGFETTTDQNESAQISKEKILIKHLLDKYHFYGRVGRPVANTSDRITVEFGLSLIQIMNVDEKNQVLETNVWYTYQWKDALLHWDPDDYDGLQKIMVPPEDVWIPDIVLYNFADSRLKEQRQALVNVFSDGTIMWMPQAILRSTCAFDTKYFPFDENECHLKFSSWTHDGTKLDLVFFGGSDKFMTDDYMPGNEWNLEETRGERNTKIYECCPDTPYIDLKFFVRLKRKTAFYSFILLLPCALLSLLTLIIFWVPPESPAKLQLDERLNEQRRALVVVEYTGDIIWMPQAILRSSCGFDTKFFPFDSQSCYLQFGSWTHDGNKLDLQFFYNISRFMIDDYIPGTEWDILTNRADRNVKIYECCKDTPYYDLKFHLTLRRKVAFYSFILILPCALLSCLTLTIFWVPPESPAKLVLGMNIFVAFFVLLLLLSESTPKAAESIPLIGAYFCLSMVMITMSTVLSTVIANMFFRGVRINRAPAWLRTVMIDCVATCLFLKDTLIEKGEVKPKSWETRLKAKNQYKCQNSGKHYTQVRLVDNGKEEIQFNNVGHFGQNSSDPVNHPLDTNQPITKLEDDIRVIREILETYNDSKAKAEQKEKYLREWKVICCITDRMFFILYLLLNIVGIVVIFFGQDT